MASDLAAFRRMERYLRGAAAQADFLLDLSNVVRATELGGAGERSLERLRLVLAALREWTGDREVTVHAIADDSLMRPDRDRDFPDPAEGALLRAWRDRGLIAAIAKADPDLLDHAKVLGTRVISADLFRGHRGEHPWIQGDREHFLEPLRGPDGSVRLVPRDMRVFADREVSRERERDGLKARNLLDFRGRPRSEVLERSWRCPRTPCNPSPALRSGKVVCRVHGTLLTDLGPRRPRLQLKILVDGVCRAWENLTEDDGREFTLGRAHLARIEERHLSDDRRGRVSRQHLVLLSSRGSLKVLDTSSAHSRIRTLRPGQEPTPWVPLPRPDQPAGGAGTGSRGPGGVRPEGAGPERRLRGFGPDDEIELVPGVVLRRSGQRWPGERDEGVRAKPPRRPRGGDELTSLG
ncbi:FHA domain-containing protein [Kitasatospora sp. NPDC093550]|uniref:FHA domain-containing protein n=1 Tax=Kitasatospora sp. NPDC093550 TaxID=3364089 RepID=UPI00380AE11E